MRIQARLLIIFLSLLVILPVFLLSSQPALAFASHIVRLKYEDDSPVAGATILLRAGEYQDCDCEGVEERWCWCHDCSRAVHYWWGYYWTGPTWQTNTDEHGITILSARSASNVGGSIGYGDIQTCSTSRNEHLVMAVPYLNGSGYWRLERILEGPNNYGGASQKDDNSSETLLRTKLAGDREEYASDPNEDHEDWTNYWLAGFSSFGFPHRANVAKIYPLSGDWDTMGGPFTKIGNVYWEWTWVGPHRGAQNLQNQPLLALAGNLWTSILNIFPKKLI